MKDKYNMYYKNKNDAISGLSSPISAEEMENDDEI
jgi:hypothetical protein